MLIRRTAMVLRVEAITLFFLGIALIANPEIATRFLGISQAHTTSELIWVLRVLGANLLIPSLLAPLVAAFAGERGLRQAASGLAFISIAIGTVCLICPGGLRLSTISTALVWYIFALLYFFALKGRGRNR
jgi:hypothetical protein